ncbi:hypothetical protein Cgig2_002026 [Carnegiea gigantea]|uniref:Uncharacterized protein n=1 Tax=Carnegiea gigantea TaxID=171969 RepID=A0A9Q1GGZ5_9CARY|nr:hypothetical protein Cgig2_002026 [Carnegiea gigantea]
MVAQLNEAQTGVATSMGFASFLKVDLKQISGKFSKWLVDSFDPYSASFMLLNGQMFKVIAFDAYVTLVVPIGGTEIIESSRSLADEEYDENCYYGKSILKYIKDVNQIASLDWCKFVVQKLISSMSITRRASLQKGCTSMEDLALKSEGGASEKRTY